MSETKAEIEYYRAVEDLFAALRGVPHVLSPKDFQLLRTWWREQVPLTAVTAGITEVFAKRRDRGEDDPVVSLSYCRHAVSRHARRLAEMRVGEEERPPEGSGSVSEAVAELAAGLRRTADTVSDRWPAVAEVCGSMAEQVARSADMPAAVLEQHLYALESLTLAGCWAALPEAEREAIEASSADEAAASGASGEALDRTRVALRDRALRRRLGLPRLELP